MFLLETNNIKDINTGLQSNLKSGSFISFTVNKKITTDVYKILLLGKYINVKSTRFLKEGSRVQAQIIWDKSKLQLKVLEKQKSGIELSGNDTFNLQKMLISEELIKSNMPLDPSYFQILEPILRKEKKFDHKLVRILLLLIDKGIPVTDNDIKEILSFTDRQDNGSLDSYNKSVWNKKENREKIKEDIKNQIKNTDTGNELIKYFNHSVAGHDNWLIIPLNFLFKRPGQGVLKLRLNDSMVITNIVLTLRDGNDWEFSLVKTSTGGKMKVDGPDKLSWEETPLFNKLKEKLYNMGIVFDDINKEWNLQDGFTDVIPGKYKGIDFTV